MKLLLEKMKECNISADLQLEIAKPCNEEDGEEIKAVIEGMTKALPSGAWDMTQKNARLCESCAKSPATTLQVLEDKSDGPGQHPNTHCWKCAKKDTLTDFVIDAGACGCGVPRNLGFRNCKTCCETRDCEDCGKPERYQNHQRCRECYMKQPCSTCKKGTRMPGAHICRECCDEMNASKTCNTLNCKQLVMPGHGRNKCHDCYN